MDSSNAEKAIRKGVLSIMDAPRALANALVPGEDLGLSEGEGALNLAFAHVAQQAIEDVYADCGDSDAAVLASNVGQRIAWNVHEVLFSGPEPTEYHAGFDAGRASRDAEVAELTRLLAESRAANGDSEARRAELEAVRAKVRMMVNEPGGFFYRDVIEMLNKAPSVVLEDRDREVAARTLEAITSWRYEDAGHDTSDPRGGVYFLPWQIRRITERAAAIRKGDTA